jgi:hypothetical protein
MNVVDPDQRFCERFRLYVDAYLDNEMPLGSQDAIQHLSFCRACSRVLAERAQVKERVRHAVRREQAPPELLAALREQFHRRDPCLSSTDAHLFQPDL